MTKDRERTKSGGALVDGEDDDVSTPHHTGDHNFEFDDEEINKKSSRQIIDKSTEMEMTTYLNIKAENTEDDGN